MSTKCKAPLSPFRMTPEQERVITGFQSACMLTTFGIVLAGMVFWGGPLIYTAMYPKKSLSLAA